MTSSPGEASPLSVWAVASQSADIGGDHDQNCSQCSPLSHPFVERLIGTIRWKYLDRMLFWTAADLEKQVARFQELFQRASLAYRTGWENARSRRLFAATSRRAPIRHEHADSEALRALAAAASGLRATAD